MAHLCCRLKTLALLTIAGLLVTASHSVLVAPSAPSVSAASTECADGIDNDFDGLVDYPQDGQCLSLHDQSEGPTGRGLFISLTDGLRSVTPGGSMTYTVTVKSDRPNIRNVDVRLFIPHQTNLISASNAGSRQGDYIIWRNVTVHPGQDKKLYANVNLDPRAKDGLLMVAEAYSEGEKATDTTRVELGDSARKRNVPLRLSVTDGKVYAEPRETLHYRIIVDNTYGLARNFRLRTDLSKYLDLISASGPYVSKGGTVEWPNLHIEEGAIQEYNLTARLEREIEDHVAVQLKVYSDTSLARDTTSVLVGAPNTAISVAVTDHLDTARIGDTVTYNIHLRNRTNKLITEVDVNNALPAHMQFVSATEGGLWLGKNVRWQGLTIAPHGTRHLQVSGRVRSDARFGQPLRNTAIVRGQTAVDQTTVGSSRISDGSNVYVASNTRAPLPRTYSHNRGPVLLRKTADRREVRPGDTVNYTVYLRNTTDRPFRGIVVQDRMNAQYMKVVGSSYGQLQGDRMSWRIPNLAPGQEWKVQYSVRIANHVPHGVSLKNVVSVSGEGMETFSLTERVHTQGMNVITSLPPTGVDFGKTFVSLSSLLGLLAAAITRRRLSI